MKTPDEAMIRHVMKLMGREGGLIGGKIAAKNMTKTERIARAKKAAAASAKVRTAKAKKRGSKTS